MRKIIFNFIFYQCVFGQGYLTVPNNVFRISTSQNSLKYQWNKGEQQFALNGIGKMYFDRFTHNDSVRFSSNYDLYHVGTSYIDSVYERYDALEQIDLYYNINTTVENWIKQDIIDLFFNLLPDFAHKETGKYLDQRM
mgnify:CR=1 FL=1